MSGSAHMLLFLVLEVFTFLNWISLKLWMESYSLKMLSKGTRNSFLMLRPFVPEKLLNLSTRLLVSVLDSFCLSMSPLSKVVLATSTKIRYAKLTLTLSPNLGRGAYWSQTYSFVFKWLPVIGRVVGWSEYTLFTIYALTNFILGFQASPLCVFEILGSIYSLWFNFLFKDVTHCVMVVCLQLLRWRIIATHLQH